MDMEMALTDLTREMTALEIEIRVRGGFVLSTAADREPEPAEPQFADTHVGYFGIWE